MKVVVFDKREDEEKLFKIWQEKNPDINLDVYSQALTMDNIDLVKGADTVCLSSVGKLDDRLYKALKDLGINVISQRSAGFDMYNLDIMNELGMKLINVPSYSPNAIGEFVVASALFFSRNLNHIYENVKNHDFRWQVPILSKEIRTLTVGIVGTGRIGRATAKLFKGLGAKIIGYDLFKSKEAEEILEYVSLDQLYAQSDIITFHVPATDDNYHMVNEKSIATMKDGVILVNAARGTILDTKAVLKGLDSGKIKGAALDVYENEVNLVNTNKTGENINDDLLEEIIARNDIVYTPHIAFYTETALDNLVSFAIDESIKYLKTGKSDSIVNK
ncbi:MAG: D-2-hydroxyacid dehydrogenase [Peptoniphilaceae bacterium]|nr:D-2-hydroxyacid dehydrogenase [Peptoniphilaceae bacterium]MDY6018293.1 D-2-hydroxyacid dehydrogenase [Anaerococcus sp.]